MSLPCSWDVTCDSCPQFETATESQRDRALWLASTYLWGATGRRFGVCPVTVRPVQAPGGEPAQYLTYEVRPGAEGLGRPGAPFLFAGRWFNPGCGIACCSGRACAVVLDGPVASVEQVSIGDELVPSASYRVDVSGGTYLLVRTDGECWPTCQDLTADIGDPGTFSVTYGRGQALPEALKIATALLACEYLKSMIGGACALPARMTSLSRQGVEIQVEPPAPSDGKTGIREVDDVIATLNPSRRQRPTVILSPDLPGGCDRMTVWSGA